MPKLSGQSLNLTGRYIYFLFKPICSKCFSLHIDIATVEKSIIRISFSNLFKEFKATTTWIQFPFVIQAPKGTVYEKAELNAKDLSGSAPPITKWTILCVDLMSLTHQYVPNRNYHSVRGYKLCANLLIKNVITSDFLYQPGMTHAEAKLKNCGVTAFPRELSYPCEKYENWYQFFDYVVFPGDNNSKSIGQSRVISGACLNETEKRTNLNKQNNSFHNVVSHSGTFDKNKQFRFKSSECLNLPLVGVSSPSDDINFVSPTDYERQNDADIHVFPFKSGHDEFLNGNEPPLLPISSLDINEKNDCEDSSENIKFQTSLEPDPILKLRKIIGFGARNIKSYNSDINDSMQSVLWSQDSQYLLYTCQAIVVSFHLNVFKFILIYY